MDLLLAAETRPFAIAALILVALIGVEMISLMLGASASHLFDKAFDGDHHGPVAEAFGWVNVGRVPMLVLITLALGAFAAAGYALQAVAHGLWQPLPSLAAAGLAFVAAVPMVRVGSRALSRLIPHDETYAVEDADLVGRTAEVTVGPLDDGLPGRVKLQDVHGNWHFPRARAAKGHGPMAVGSTVLLVDREGTAFLAIPAPEDLVTQR